MASDNEPVEIDPHLLTELFQRLSDKRAAVQRELATLREAPGSKKNDVFQLCRGFERAFTTSVQSVEIAGLIKRAFTGDDGLTGQINRLPMEKKFTLVHVKETVREADGYQSHLVSPEKGLRRLVQEALQLSIDPVLNCVRQVHQLLLQAAREAARSASAHSEESAIVDEKKESLRLPGFEAAVQAAASKALEEWREEALDVAHKLVLMEQSYVSAAFFRKRTYERYKMQREQQEKARMLAEGGGVADDDGSDSDSEETGSEPSPEPRSMRRTESETSHFDGPMAGGLTLPVAQAAPSSDPGDLKTGYLEKRIGEKSGRQSLPLDSWKWQKRYFVLTEPKGMLYYFKSADDPPNYKGLIPLRDCKVEDVDADGVSVKSTARSKYEIDGGGGSLLIRISHKDSSKPCVKNHHSIVLRAETPAEKYAWLARLRYASDAASAQRTPIRSFTSQKVLDDLKRNSTRPRDDDDAPKTPQEPAKGFGSRLADKFADLKGGDKVAHELMAPSPGLHSRNQQVFDEYLRQLGHDTAAYVRTVCNSIVLTVPKAIVHCQVKRAQAHLLERLYSYITAMGGAEAAGLLEEDPQVMQRRAAAKTAIRDLEEALGELTALQERRADDPKARAAPVRVAAKALELGGMTQLLPSSLERQSSLYGDYTPRSLQQNSYFGNGHPERREPQRSTSQNSRGSSSFGGNSGGGAGEAPLPRRVSNSGDARNAAAAASLQERPPSARSRGTPPPKVTIPSPAVAATVSPSPVPRRPPPPAPPGGSNNPSPVKTR